MADPSTHLLSFRSLKTYPETDCGTDATGRRTCVPACAIDASLKRLETYSSGDELSVEMTFADPLERTDDKTISRGFQFKLATNESSERAWVEGLRCTELQLKKIHSVCTNGPTEGKCSSFIKIKIDGYPRNIRRDSNFLFPN